MSVISAKRNTAVIITAKDAEGTAPAAVDSALAQSMVSEVVFVDDGSRDNTAAVAQACDDGLLCTDHLHPGCR
jgi:succinoglycan biosynthesis protein ExoU